MWTLLFLCGVLATHGVQGADRYMTTEAMNSTSDSPAVRCGGYLFGFSGTFYSPNYPNMYPEYTDCTWYIRADSPIVELEFSNVSIENHPTCGFDRIDIYDGSTIDSRLLGKVCGTNAATFHSTSSYLTVRFRSDSSVSLSGFRADFRVVGSCKYNCGYQVGNCSCSSRCGYFGNCCPDYNVYCPSTTASPDTTAQPSCRYNCGGHMGSCSCTSSCQYYGNCCHDYYSECQSTTETTVDPTTAGPSCRYNCGGHMGSCSCTSSCQYYGNCCHDYYSECQSTTETTVDPTTAGPSCRYNCGGHMGSCSCRSSCQYYGNCCHDYYSQCQSTTVDPTTAGPSCRYNCDRYMGSCSCTSSCQYYGNCCHDYYSECQSTTETTVDPTTAEPSCRYNCGGHMGSCSCRSSCQYYGNCCHDYYSYCYSTTDVTPTERPCGGSLFGSGTFSSPNHPGYYHNNAYCVWQIRSAYDQRIYLALTFLQLENCCSCDYIAVYDGPSVGSRYLGKACNNSLSSFKSSSNYMTVLFRTDGSVVGRGFNAEFKSTLQPSDGRVDCSSDMNIVIARSYLNSLGYDGHNLYLNDPHCRPRVSSYQVVFSFPINTCGNVRQFDNGRVVYTNSLRAYASISDEITRQPHLKLNVSCRMEQDSVSQILYHVNHSDSSSIMGTGRFNTSMAFYTSSSFYYKVTEVPYEVDLNQNLYIQVDLRKGNSSLVIFLDTCVASPSAFDFTTRPYYLVRNGCSVDNTYWAYVSGTRAYARFRFKAFKFLRATESVYIQCKVLICPASEYNSRCRRGCTKRIARDLGSRRDSETLLVGPIRLKDPEKKEEETDQQNKA
ncbi:scavenger receptor cysteine-rich domain-containing protein DMBT1 isoform X3 [Embiotoca jacksoni]|uniref:scavenger receptor cysteine-rich domain-containing protein DMBT1 isoform X3 n=1 Tax=Embiotoca jacksoni TaxID=100190 RepID=UPI003703E94C